MRRIPTAPAHSPATQSFYHLEPGPLQLRSCQGLACFAARHTAPQRWQQSADGAALFCVGQCYAAPARSDECTRPAIYAVASTTVLLNNIAAGGVRDLHDYQHRGGGNALRQILQSDPQTVIAAIEQAELRGRGGAGFSTGRKWRAVANETAVQKYVIANADEGDPGAFSDRLLLEDDPFLLIEALLIAGLTVGATRGYIYLRKEYAQAETILRAALLQAQTQHWLGENILGTQRRFDIELVIGAGSYVCGEETSLLNSIEGRRPEVRVRPPQITAHGLFDAPTLVNNVETLCSIPWIINHGAAAYARLGTTHSRGTKLLSLNSLFKRPGLYEVEFGISVRDIVDKLGGGLQRDDDLQHDKKLLGVMIGGPLAGLVPPTLLDTPLCYDALHAIGCALGHGGVIAFADDTSITDIVAQVFRFGALESCGKCTPCFRGSPELAHAFAAARTGKKIERARWHALIEALAATSLCGHGRGLAEFAHAIERHYPQELAVCFA